jgi:hypothetical protein
MSEKPCQTCASWGETITDLYQVSIRCPDCGRKTFPNLGVNCPAGMAVALSAMQCQLLQLKMRHEENPQQIYNPRRKGRDRWSHSY